MEYAVRRLETLIEVDHSGNLSLNLGKKGNGHPCTGTEALYRPYGP